MEPITIGVSFTDMEESKQKEEFDADAFLEEFSDEIESLKRVYNQYKGFRDWLLPTAMAVLTFVITIYVQIRLNDEHVNGTLAKLSIATLVISIVVSGYFRFMDSMVSLNADAKIFVNLMPLFIKLTKEAEEISEEGKQTLIGWFEKFKESSKKKDEPSKWGILYALVLPIIAVVSLFLGLLLFCIDIWNFIF